MKIIILLLAVLITMIGGAVAEASESGCWAEDLALNMEWDAYYNSSIERLLRHGSTIEIELSWLTSEFPLADKDKVNQCLTNGKVTK